MQRKTIRLVALIAALALLLPAAAAMAAAPRDVVASFGNGMRPDKRSHPLGDKMVDLKKVAIRAQAEGKAKGKVYEVVPGEFVQLALEGTGQVWTVPAEFSDYLHNEILAPDPDPLIDNTSYWVEDFSAEHYDAMLFDRGEDVNSMAEFFLEQSSGRFTVDGEVEDWVAVPNDHLYYDDGNEKNDTSENVWLFLADSLDAWYEGQIDAGKTPEEIDAYLARFDEWDRYDHDGDGNFEEPDGYIDHFQSLHAGLGEEEGGGILGDEAIWSHSWYANFADIGDLGPEGNLLGGVQIGESGYWVGDYTIQPENGSVGVFTHEFTHDLGAPDLYDYYGENGTAFWTLMSSGSWLSDNPYNLGTAPNHQDAWVKLQLGWLNYEVATPGETTKLTIGPAEYNSSQPQALLVSLGDKEVTWNIGDPFAGEWFYYSDQGNDLHNKMYKQFTLPEGAQLSAMVNYGIEERYDYASVIVSTDGLKWATVPTNLSNSIVEENGIDGFTDGDWVELTADLSDYEGVYYVGFAYDTDVGVAEVGFMVDDISISGYDVDGAEADAGWTFDGYKTTTGDEGGWYWNYYLAEYRQYWGYDVALSNCYNFGFLLGRDPRPNYAERYAYQDGLLIWYCDDSVADNNTALHPGTGIALPVDAHPDVLLRGGTPWRNRVQSYDATFGLWPTDAMTLHYNCKPWKIPSLPAVPVFDDMLDFYDESNPLNSVDHPHSGTVIEVLGTAPSADGASYMGIEVTAPLLP